MDIYKNIKDGIYTVPVSEKPIKPAKICPKCKKKYVIPSNFCSHCGESIDHEMIERVYIQSLAKYNDKRAKASWKFKFDALKYCGIEKHSKADNAWKLAEDYGDGSKVLIIEHLEDLSELMK